MKNPLELHKHSEKMHLTREEKGHILSVLKSHMELYPLPQNRFIESPIAMFMPHRALVMVLASVFFFVISGTGALFAAQKSLPGEPLYLVKKDVSEELYSLFIRDSEAKARYEASRIDKRLEEAQLLSEEGKLTLATKESLEESISIHAEKASKLIEDTSSKGSKDIFALAEDVALAQLEGSVEAKKTLLAELPTSDGAGTIAQGEERDLSEDLSRGVPDNDSGLLKPYVRPLSQEELRTLETTALAQADSTRSLLSKIVAGDGLHLEDQEITYALASIDRVSEELESIKLKAETEDSIRDRTRLLRELITTSEKIKTYFNEIIENAGTSTPSEESTESDGLLIPQQ